MTLEGDKSQVEVVEPTPTEEAKPTESKEEPTVDVTQSKEFKHAFDKALGKSTESLQRQVSLSKQGEAVAKAEIEEHKANVLAFEAEVKDLRDELDGLAQKQFEGDSDARTAYIDRRSITDAKREVAKEKANVERKLYEAEKLAWSAAMAKKSVELVKETGIDPVELEQCKTEEEMEVKSLRFQLNKPPEKKPEEKKDPKFDSLGGTGSGADWRKLSASGKIEYGLRHKKK